MRKPSTLYKCIIAAAAVMLPSITCAQISVAIDAARRGASIGRLHYGIFYEEINHAGDGGLYAELVKNRSFEDNNTQPEAWTAVGGATMKLVSNDLMEGNAHALQASFKAAGDGVENAGYWGMNAVEGRRYTLTLHLRGEFSGNLTAALVSADGRVLGSAQIAVTPSSKWRKYSAVITAAGNDPKASLRITSPKAGTVEMDCVSLFPPTYKDRPNGCRPDLAQLLEAMHPAFVRFPGGCFVEGQNSSTGHNRFEWKKAIGPIENRPGHWNQNWNYRCTDGLGFHELLQLTEDLGAEPLFVVNIGMGHGWTQDYRQLDEYIQEALDAIEYCNGDVTTTWGAVRAANGHPEPFGLRLLEIGNENYQADASQQSDHYAERYKAFYDAIKAKYPDITLIGNVEAWGTDNPSWRNPYPCEVVDEHYYRNPSWFASQYNKYDSYDRSRPKVYVGEYAVTSDFGTNGHLTAALGEATFMLGMENNSDVCVMNSYAPIFVNENDQKWKPDMIRFNSAQSFGTPSYHVQQLMSAYHGSQNVGRTETGNIESTGHKTGLSTWSTTATFDNVKITAPDGRVLYQQNFASAPSDWHAAGGTWTVTSGELRQTDASMQGKIYLCDFETPDSYTLELDATKNTGAEGFLVAFNYGDERNYAWWNLGGWGNTKHAIEVCRDGSKSSYDPKAGALTAGHKYHVKIEVDGAHVSCYLDGELIHDVTLPSTRKLYMSSSIDEAAGMLYLKVVNTSATAQALSLSLANARFDGVEDVTVLASAEGTDENTMSSPANVAPAAGSMQSLGETDGTYAVPPYSLSILRLRLKDISKTPTGTKPSEADLQAVRTFLEPARMKLANLHASASLPTASKSGATIDWSYTGGNGLTLSQSNWAAMLNVSGELPEGNAVKAGTLTADITFPAGEKATIDFPVTLAPTDGMYGYLYCYMKNNKEITNFALGTRGDRGRTFNQLLGGDEVFDTHAVAGIEHGTRDAFIGRGEQPDRYFITTTDMCNATSKVWNNYGLNLVRSTDLIHWEGATFDFRQGKSIFSDPAATTGAYNTDAEYAKITRVWAPQWIWDPAADNGRGAYLVYYSLLSSNTGDNHDRIFYSYADKDFRTLTQPRVFYDPGYSVIDADIVYNPYDGLYHMCIKREGASGCDRGIYLLSCDKLVGGTWKEYLHVTNEGSELVEGATLMRRIDEDAYNLYYMRYSGGSAYKVCELDHLCDNVSGSANLSGTGNFQHGSVMQVPEDEYRVLQGWSDLRDLMAEVEKIGSPVFTQALSDARAALENTTVAALAVAIPKAIDGINAARADYVRTLIDAEGNADLTAMLINPDFTNGGSGWQGIGFTQAKSGVAEHWNKTFDTWQTLEGMPAGWYTFACQGFYRYGNKDGYESHKDGTEQLLAEIYANVESSQFISLFDDRYPYTYSPYTYPDNVDQANAAFNTHNRYQGNAVTVHLEADGPLRVGIRKSVERANDWTCFDNFTLRYSATPVAISEVNADPSADGPVDVYTPTGALLRHGVALSRATDGLAPGIYLVGNRKTVVR